MTRVKSLKPSGIEQGPGATPSGFTHRTHQPSKSRRPDHIYKKQTKKLLIEKAQRIEEKDYAYERRVARRRRVK